MFSPPKFADRLRWDAVAAPVRSRIEVLLGSAVINASTRVGGFSPGFAGVLITEDGRTVFAKAVSTAQNASTPALLRAERDISAAIPANPHVPRLLHWVEEAVGDDEWVALIFEAVSGSSPALPWGRQDAVLVLRSLERLSDLFTPAPIPTPVLPELLASMAGRWAKAEEEGSPGLTRWIRERLPELTDLAWLAGAPGGLMAGETLLHIDLRADNLLIDRSGSSPHVWFVDWPWACVGPRWVDAALLALDFAAYGDHRPEEVLQEVDIRLPSEALPALLACLAGDWALALSRPAPVGMTGLREFQRRFFDATISWLQRCMSW